jgi:hypothetical protein
MYHTTIFYRGNMVVYLTIVYEYEGSLVIIIDDNLVDNIKFGGATCSSSLGEEAVGDQIIFSVISLNYNYYP